MEAIHHGIKVLILVLAFFTATLPASAVPQPTCADQGMWTWVFASGVLGGGTEPAVACEDAWNDFASTIADSPGFSISYGTTLVSVDPPICVGTYYCKACRGFVADPVDFAPAPVSPGQAGQVAERIAPGEIVKIERVDDFHGMPIAYTVDIVGPEGKVQVVVNGETGQGALVEPDDQGYSSCQAPNQQ